MAESVNFPWGLYYIVEEIDGNETHVHRVMLEEVKKKESYIQLGSLNGFRRRMVKRHASWIDKHGRKPIPRNFRIMFPDQYEFECGLEYMPIGKIEVREAGDIWAFYKHVGYDHKRDKFIPVQP